MQKSIFKKKRADILPAENTAGMEHYRRQIMANTGVGSTLSVDPVYRLTAGFSEQFNAMGMLRNQQRHGNVQRPSTENEEQQTEQIGQEPDSRERLSVNELRRRHDSPVYSHTNRQLEDGDFIDRFSSLAFQGGALATSIMAGKGKQMFTTCFRRAGIFPGAITEQQRKLPASRATEANVQNQPARLVYGREAHTAVGIVVDSIRSSVRTLDVFKQLANDDKAHSQNRLQQAGIDTLRQMYPFLQLENDEMLIERYKAQLKQLEGDDSPEAVEKRKNVDSALKKATAVKQRKLSEQRKFLTKLSQINSNVREAERIFSADGFVDSFLEELFSGLDTPPEDDGDKRRTLDGSVLEETLDALFSEDEELDEFEELTEEQEISDD